MRLVEAVHSVLQISLGSDAMITLQIEIACDHIKFESIDYELQSEKDSLFGIKFVIKIDRKSQSFFYEAHGQRVHQGH